MLYNEKQIGKSQKESLSSYEFCVLDSTLALYLIKINAQEIKEKIDIETKNLRHIESELVNLIINSHNEK